MLSCLPLPFNYSIQHSEYVFTGSCVTGLQMYCESGLYCAVFRRSSAALVHLEILGNRPALHPWAKHELEPVTPVLVVLPWLLARLQTTLARAGLTVFVKFWEGGILALAAPVPDTCTFCEWQSEPELRCWMGKAVPTAWGLCFGWGWLWMWAEIMVYMVTKPSLKIREHHCLNCPDAPCGTAQLHMDFYFRIQQAVTFTAGKHRQTYCHFLNFRLQWCFWLRKVWIWVAGIF